MRKSYLMILSSLLLVLGACGNQSSETEPEEVEEQETVTENNEETESDQESEAVEESEEEAEENSEDEDMNDEQVGELEELDEYEMLDENIDLTEYTPDVKEDNSYKRIILFKDSNNHEKYKSIYIKKENRLKIIEFDEGLIYNEKI